MKKAKKCRMKSAPRYRLKKNKRKTTRKIKPVYKSSDNILDIFIKSLFS